MAIAVDRDRAAPLRRHGTGLVVADPGELLERQRAP
jgi:hypothetical protein